MSILEALVLGLVQGLTEFIPISSTAHLEIVPVLLGWGDPGAAASAVIQFGTFIAAVIYFFRDIVRLVAGFFRGLVNRRPLTDVDSREAWLVVIGTIPIVVLGLLLKKHIESTFRGLWVVTTMVIVVAILMLIAEGYAKRRRLREFELFNERHHLAQLGWTPIVVSIAIAFVFGYASIWFLLRYLRSHTTHIFI